MEQRRFYGKLNIHETVKYKRSELKQTIYFYGFLYFLSSIFLKLNILIDFLIILFQTDLMKINYRKLIERFIMRKNRGWFIQTFQPYQCGDPVMTKVLTTKWCVPAYYYYLGSNPRQGGVVSSPSSLQGTTRPVRSNNQQF